MATPEVAHETLVGLRAELIISGEDVEVQGVLGKDFFFALSQEARLGTPISFAYWLQKVYKVDSEGIKMLTLTEQGVPDLDAFQRAYKADKGKAEAAKELPPKIRANLKAHNVPEQVHELMVTALLAELSITDLIIDVKKDEKTQAERKKLKFGLAITFPSPLPLLPNIDVKRVSILILHTPVGDTDFPDVQKQQKLLGKPEPVKIKASGFIAFSGQPDATGTITLGGATWTFVSGEPKASETKIGKDLDETLGAVARDLNRFDSPDAVRKCTYRADLQNRRLVIEYSEPGPEGNTFILDADPKSKGAISAKTLQGGEDPEAPLPRLTAPASTAKASGTIKFKQKPDPDKSVTLNAVKFVFKAKPADVTNAATEVLNGKNIAEALQNLKDKAAASTDLAQFTFEHDGKDTLTITAKQEGDAGKSFTLATDSDDTFELSGKTLGFGT